MRSGAAGPWALGLALCAACPEGGEGSNGPAATTSRAEPDDRYAAARAAMVQRQGVEDERVLAALRAVPRHELVPEGARDLAYEDHPVSIGHGQTISQPYIVALMTELSHVADLGPGAKVLEIGTGSGYQAAVLAELGAQVYSIEIVEALGQRARADLERLGYAGARASRPGRVHLRIGDGYAGWPSEAPFDAIVLTAAPAAIPAPLKEQLKVGGRLVAPVGERVQQLRVLTRTVEGFASEDVTAVRFVPMTGRAQE